MIFEFLFIQWSTLFKKPFIKLLFLLRGFCNAFCNPRILNSFSLYFGSNFRKIFVIRFKNIYQRNFRVQCLDCLGSS